MTVAGIVSGKWPWRPGKAVRMWYGLALLIAAVAGAPLMAYLLRQAFTQVRLSVAGGMGLGLLGAAALAVIAHDGRQLAAGMAERRWPRVEGMIVRAQFSDRQRLWVREADEMHEEELPADQRASRRDRNFRPQVTYAYTVAGTAYEVTGSLRTPGFGGTLNRLDVAMKEVGRYPPGTAVTVFYRPDAPAVSTLRPGPVWADFVRPMAAAWVLAGVLGAFLAARR